MKKTTLILLLSFTTLIGCKTQVQRMSENSTTDLSGRWNESDSRLTAEEITSELMSGSWQNTFSSQNDNKKPVIIVGMITNKTHEHIPVETFSKDIEKEIINSDRMRIVQAGSMREELRAERADQQEHSSLSTIKKFGLEHGADFMLQGTITSIVDEIRKDKTVYYQVDLELSNIETNEKVWIGDKKIKKYIGRKKM